MTQKLKVRCTALDSQVTCEAFVPDPNELAVGEIKLRAWTGQLQVTWVSVRQPWRRTRVATTLYEAAAREAKKRGLMLTSDSERTDGSQAFWDKQVRKGRAHCIQENYGARKEWQHECRTYGLVEGAGGDLSGVRKRRGRLL